MEHPRRAFGHVVSEEEAATKDIVYFAPWPGGIPEVSSPAPTLIPLGPPVPGPHYERQLMDRERKRAEAGITREEFFEWARTLGLEMFVWADGTYRMRADRKARRTRAENLRSWMWD